MEATKIPKTPTRSPKMKKIIDMFRHQNLKISSRLLGPHVAGTPTGLTIQESECPSHSPEPVMQMSIKAIVTIGNDFVWEGESPGREILAKFRLDLDLKIDHIRSLEGVNRHFNAFQSIRNKISCRFVISKCQTDDSGPIS